MQLGASFVSDFEWIYRNVKEKDLRKHFRSDIGSHISLWFVIAPLCDHFRFLTTLTTIRQHLAFICSCPHFPDHVLPRLHYYAIIPRLILIMVIINDCPPPRVNKATEVRGGKGGLDLPPLFWTGKHTHLKWFKTLSRGDVVVFNISCLFDIIEIGIIDIICKFRLMLKIKKSFAEIYDKKVRKWAKCGSWRQNEAVCWILHFHQWPIPIFTAVL